MDTLEKCSGVPLHRFPGGHSSLRTVLLACVLVVIVGLCAWK